VTLRLPLLSVASVALALSAISCGPTIGAPVAGDASHPRVRDDRLHLTLFAEEPDIVTPIGIASDARGRLFVLESHTHMPPSGYDGPKGDLVKILEDTTGEGRADRVRVFAEGVTDGMNLAFSPSGELYLVAARGVWVLHDRDGDDVSEARTLVLDLVEPEQVYAHAALLGLAFSHDGWMYVSRGNTGGSRWRLVGTDGSVVAGYGDGGNIVRARPDGSHLEEVATGFWNPFDLAFDDYGRLLAADNDPDSRGPNRLVHVVRGGDYGYRSLHGGSGIHPYLAWNGELPGTLPYAAGLGEAPSGLLNTSHAALPRDYAGELLCTIWEESRIVSIRLTPHGTSVRGDTRLVVEGGQRFRPVALAPTPAGEVYISDWGVREYPNHGRGRVWRLATRAGEPLARRRSAFDEPLPDSGRAARDAIESASTSSALPQVRNALMSDDPFLRTAGIVALTRPALQASLSTLANDASADARLGAIVALERAGHPDGERVAQRLLRDADPRVRQRALVWIGRAGFSALRDVLDEAIASPPVSADLFETYLETVRFTDPDFVRTHQARAERAARNIPRPLPAGLVEALATDARRPTAVRAAALLHLEDPSAHGTLLAILARGDGEVPLRLEAVRSLGRVSTSGSTNTLAAIATQQAAPVPLRAEALLWLGLRSDASADTIASLLDDAEPDVRLEAARALRARHLPAGAAARVQAMYDEAAARRDEALRDQLALVLDPDVSTPRPSSDDGWHAALATGGDPMRGRRVFYSAQATCAACHAIDRRGGTLGPDLSNAGLSKSRRQLVDAILQPSAEISPEWQGWFIRETSGTMHVGRQIDVRDTIVDLYTQSDDFISVPLADIDAYGMVETSLMPEGLESQLTVHDMRDLIAFLASTGSSAAPAAVRSGAP
jgi:putative membrane-bound dehydrogenase-like protein